jgi:hypothetical protein
LRSVYTNGFPSTFDTLCSSPSWVYFCLYLPLNLLPLTWFCFPCFFFYGDRHIISKCTSTVKGASRKWENFLTKLMVRVFLVLPFNLSSTCVFSSSFFSTFIAVSFMITANNFTNKSLGKRWCLCPMILSMLCDLFHSVFSMWFFKVKPGNHYLILAE